MRTRGWGRSAANVIWNGYVAGCMHPSLYPDTFAQLSEGYRNSNLLGSRSCTPPIFWPLTHIFRHTCLDQAWVLLQSGRARRMIWQYLQGTRKQMLLRAAALIAAIAVIDLARRSRCFIRLSLSFADAAGRQRFVPLADTGSGALLHYFVRHFRPVSFCFPQRAA